MTGIQKLEQIKIEYRNYATGELLPVYIDVFSNSLSEKWLTSLNTLLKENYHLEKNYCFMGWLTNKRNGQLILDQLNKSIFMINSSQIGYKINDYFSLKNTITDNPVDNRVVGRNLIHDKMNKLHRYFEDLQGTSTNISPYYKKASAEIKWHIRQLNLLCHEFESWALSYRKEKEAPEWMCPSQLMCYLNAPRFELDQQDFEQFGIERISRATGAVCVGVNKAVGKHHWEVFNDEGRDSRIDELTTTTLNSQTEATGDFDIEWGRDVSQLPSRKQELLDFRNWLEVNGFNPEDTSLTLGHPQVGQVNFDKSFGHFDILSVWKKLGKYLDVFSISTSDASAKYDYHWSDSDYQQRQVNILQ